MRLSAIVPVLLFPAFGVVAGAEYDNRPEALLAAMGTAPAEVVVCDTVAGGIPDFHLSQEKDHSSRRFLLILGMGALLSAVSAGVAVSAVILYHLGIIFGVFLPCKPVKNPLVLRIGYGAAPCSVWVRVHLGAVFIAPVPAFSQACAPGVKSGRYCP